jgi:hypothetical protein
MPGDSQMRCRALLPMTILSLPTLSGVACKRETPQPTTPTIPLKVWVVLNTQTSDVFDEPGHADNQGCRLSMADITSYIAALQNNRHIFGANFALTWDQTAEVVRSQYIPLYIPPLPRDRRSDVAQAMTDIMVGQGEWEPNHINIYFCGWMSLHPSTMEADAGITVDPVADYPFIVINDRGWNADSGYFVNLIDHIFEHEMTHFFLRRTGIPPYDQGEHVPDGSQNILDEFPPHPLILPTSEQAEAAARIRNGTWDNP